MQFRTAGVFSSLDNCETFRLTSSCGNFQNKSAWEFVNLFIIRPLAPVFAKNNIPKNEKSISPKLHELEYVILVPKERKHLWDCCAGGTIDMDATTGSQWIKREHGISGRFNSHLKYIRFSDRLWAGSPVAQQLRSTWVRIWWESEQRNRWEVREVRLAVRFRFRVSK